MAYVSLWGSLHRSEKLCEGLVSGWPYNVCIVWPARDQVHILLRCAHQPAFRSVKTHAMEASHAAHLNAHAAAMAGQLKVLTRFCTYAGPPVSEPC